VASLGPFSAPEELAGAKPTAQADVYGLAATIQWWLTREWPRGGRDPEEAVRRVKEGGPAVALRKIRPDVPAGLAQALEGALEPGHREEASARERFLRAARALQGIAHENVVGMRGVGEQSGTPYAVMQFVDGPDLATLILREGALPAARAVRIAAGIARGLA